MPSGKKGKGHHKSSHKHHQKPKQSNPLSDCKFPHDVVLNILSRLPVKTLLRFRCVCKPFKTLILSPKFITLHLNRHHSTTAATSPLSSLLLHSVHYPTLDNYLSLFSLQKPLSSLSSSRQMVESSVPKASLELDVAGTHNGLVCLVQPPLAYRLSVLNPATRKFLHIQTPDRLNPILYEHVSVGFGFDPVENNHKVICIFSPRGLVEVQSRLYVYNCEKGDWRKVKIDGPNMSVRSTKCCAVIKGVPYWDGLIDDVPGGRWVLFWFDVNKEVFHHIAMPMMPQGRQSYISAVEWKGSFAFLMVPKDEGVFEYISVVVMEDKGEGGEWWNIKHRIGPVSGFNSVIGCSRNGYIVGMDEEGDLFLYDPETGGTHEFGIDKKTEGNFEVYNFTESLVSFTQERPMSTLFKLTDIMKRGSRGIGEKLKVKYNSFNILTLHHPLGNGGSIAVMDAGGEYRFGRVDEDGFFEEDGNMGRVPSAGQRSTTTVADLVFM